MSAIRAVLMILVSLLFLAGCGTVRTYPQHTLMFDQNGNLVPIGKEPGTGEVALGAGSADSFEGQDVQPMLRSNLNALNELLVDRDLTQPIFEAMEEWLAERDLKEKKVLIYFHGGLNTFRKSHRRVEDVINAGVDDEYFPIFVNWPSGLFAATGDRLFEVRQGQRRPVFATLTFPYTLARDLAVGILDTPSAVVENSIDEFAIQRESWEEEKRKAICLAATGMKNSQPTIQFGGDERKTKAKFGLQLARWQPTSVLKIGATPVIAGLGSQAWKIMRRRIHLLFHFAEPSSMLEPQTSNIDGPQGEGDGLLSRFLVELAKRQAQERFEVTMIGHSMGGILVNESLRAVPDLDVRNIVYMASADSIVDTEHVLFGGFRDTGYLDIYPDTRVFHLTLHEQAEVDQRFTKLEFVPRGSLLVWIDGFLTDPATPYHRTAGRLENLVPAYGRTPERYRERIFIKSFPYGVPGYPQKHGDFDDGRFWEESFWLPAEPAECDDQD